MRGEPLIPVATEHIAAVLIVSRVDAYLVRDEIYYH